MARLSSVCILGLGSATGLTLCLAALPLAAQPAAAGVSDAAAAAVARDPRSPSADGNFWVEVEVTIFSSVYGSTPYSEVPVPDSNNLRYLPQLRLLVNPADAYAFPFAPPTPVETAAVPVVEPVSTALPTPLPVSEGPVFSPAVAGAFKLPDVDRDAYVALDRRFWRFNQLNSRLQSGDEHAVLWHQVWRQPLRSRAQTPALQIIGGETFGNHNVLEGSLRLSSQGQGLVADLDANLWLTSFANQLPAMTEDTWKLPDQPVLEQTVEQEELRQVQDNNNDATRIEGDAVVVPVASWYPTAIWQLNQSRDVGPNALYYLDHPAMGLLIEIRPYLVPDLVVPATDTTANPAAAAFE